MPSPPANWSTARLGNLVGRLTSGATPQSGSPRFYAAEGIPFAKIDDLTATSDRFLRDTALRITPAAVKETAAKEYPSGTILISMYGTIGIVRTTTVPLAGNQALAALTPPYGCDGNYLAHQLLFSRPRLERLAGQTTQANINGSTLREFLVALPPLSEQRAIAAILDTIDAAIASTQQIIEKLHQVKRGLLHDVLTLGIDDNGDLRDPQRNPEQFQDSPVGRIPKRWKVKLLGDQAKVTVGYVGPTNPFYTDQEHGVLFLRTGNITTRGIDIADVRWVTSAFHSAQQKSALHAGDIVVSRVGYTGTAAVVPDLGPVNCANMIIIRVGPLIRPAWVRRLFEGDIYMRQVAGFTAGSAQPVLNIGLVERLNTPVPSVEEQNSSSRVLDDLDQRIEAEMHARSKLSLLKQGLADDLLTGRVRTASLGEVEA